MSDFKRLFDILRGHRIFIQAHNFPDADAIGSLLGMKNYLAQNGIDSTILYVGSVEQFSTALMIKTLNIDLINANSIKDMTCYDYTILVDAQKGNSNLTDLPTDEVVCIDHHPVTKQNAYRYSDLRPEVGSCCAIIASYFVNTNTPMDKITATALLYGIKMDTAELSRGVSELDIDMFYYLYKKADLTLISKMQIKTMQFKDLTSFGTAIQNMRVFDNLAIAKIDGSFPDGIIAAVSDFILSVSEIDLAVVYSLRQDGIKLSVRSRLSEYNAGEVTSTALYGIGSGGGHAEMAGGFIEKDKIPDLIDWTINFRFLAAFGKLSEFQSQL